MGVATSVPIACNSHCCGSTHLVAEVVQVNSERQTFPGCHGDVELAMCVSGGGTRALSFSLGVYRELWSLGVIPKIDCISSISGGTWASAVFMFAKEYKGTPISTHDLLGELTDPTELTLDMLHREPAPLAAGATKSSVEASAWIFWQAPTEQFYQRLVGEIYLKDFGLESMHARMVASEADKERIIGRNPQLRNEQFLVPRAERPRTFVMGGTLLGPKNYRANGQSAVSLQMSPDFTGCPFYPNNSTVTYTRTSNLVCCLPRDKELLVGGGLVETFAFNGDAPEGPDQSGGLVEVGAPCGIPMSLCQAAGISSDAPASTLQLFPGMSQFTTPQVTYWPVTSSAFPKAQPAARFDAGDGGSLDNSGLLALVQRGAKKVMWVASSYRALNSDYDFDVATAKDFDPIKAGVTEQLYDKFGYGYESANNYYAHNQVFDREALFPLVKQIATLKNKGKPAVVSVTLDIIPNTWWGIEGGRSLEICLIYLEKVANFEESLPTDTQKELAMGENGAFPGFPIYQTSLADLKPCQVNLLAAQGEYSIRENTAEIMEFFR